MGGNGPVSGDGLMQTKELDDAYNASFWRGICPKLSIKEEGAYLCTPLSCSAQEMANMGKRIENDGYAMLTGHSHDWPVLLDRLREGIEALKRSGWPPSFIMMFDEAWTIMNAVSPVMEAVTGNTPNMDMLAWSIDPRKGEAGFSPHRDRQPDCAATSFRADGTPRYATCWLALSDATPDTSCLYVIPKGKDPGYTAGDPEDESAPDPLRAALPDKSAFQDVRALPCSCGEAVLFTHRIIHWGSAGTAHAPAPRVSISFGFSDETFEAPYISREHLPQPPLAVRLALVAAQMVTYYQRFRPSAALLSFYKAAMDAAGDALESGYRRKVLSEFVRAAREAHEQRGEGDEREGVEGAPGGAEDEADVVDQAMDAMLDAELEGQNDFEDDFDDISEAGGSAAGGSSSDHNNSDPADSHAGGAAAARPGGEEAAAAALDAGAAEASAGGGNVSEAPEVGMPAAAAAASGVAASAVDAPGDSSTVMCADLSLDTAEEHASAAPPSAFTLDGIMRWGKKRKR